MERTTIPRILCCLAVVLAIDTASAGTTIYRDRYVAPTKAAHPRSTLINHDWTTFACYDTVTGKLVDCSFTQEIVGLKEPASPDNNGGHFHDGHPLIEPADGNLIYPENTCPGEPLKVCGRTNYSITSKIIHNIPQASGNIVKKSVVIAPARPTWWPAEWICWFGCDDDSNVFTYNDTVHVSVQNLVELPPASDIYIRCGLTSGCVSDGHHDDMHPQPSFGRRELVQKLVGLAAMYRSSLLSQDESQKLRISDISLPFGGVFDMNHNWLPPHKSHRKGISADISRHAILNNLGTSFVNQKLLDVQIGRLGLNRNTETSARECPSLNQGEPPCIHVDMFN